MGLLFVTPPQIPPAARQSIVARYIAQQAHYVQVWNIVNLYADVLLRTQLPRVPTLIVWGDSDRVFDVSGALELQRAIPSSRMYELRNAGHLLHVERAADVAVLYSSFLRDVTAGSARERPEAAAGGAGRTPVVAAADFTCDTGKAVTAAFTGDPRPAVELSLSDGRRLVLPQAVSASGARYASPGDRQVFWNKGKTAFLTEEGTTTFAGCVSQD